MQLKTIIQMNKFSAGVFVFSLAFMFSTAFKLAVLVFLTSKRKKPVRLGLKKHPIIQMY
jgi:hypothetical protein